MVKIGVYEQILCTLSESQLPITKDLYIDCQQEYITIRTANDHNIIICKNEVQRELLLLKKAFNDDQLYF